MANIKETMKGKKYPGQTARICDKRQMCCDEQHHFVMNGYLLFIFSINILTSLLYARDTGMISSQS